MLEESRLREWLREDFAIDVARAAPAAGGADVNAEVFHVVTTNGTEYAVKLTTGPEPAWTPIPGALTPGPGLAWNEPPDAAAFPPGNDDARPRTRETRWAHEDPTHPRPTHAAPTHERSARGKPALDGVMRGRPYSRRDGLWVSVTSWVRGRAALDGGLSAEQWSAFGRLLRRTHDLPATIAPGLPREDYLPDRYIDLFDRVDDAVASRAAAVGGGRAAGPREAMGEASTADRSRRGAAGEASTAGGSRREAMGEAASAGGGQAADRRGATGEGDRFGVGLVAAWSAARADLLRVRERAVRVGMELRGRDERPGPVVCHADPHLGNVVVTGEREVALIDWDDAVLAPAERDLMFVYGGVLAFAPVTEEQRGWFFEGYGDAAPDPIRLAYFRCVRTLEDIAVPAARILDGTAGDDDERATALDHVTQVLSPTGLLRQALG